MHGNSLYLPTNLVMFESQNLNRINCFSFVWIRMNSISFWHNFWALHPNCFYFLCYLSLEGNYFNFYTAITPVWLQCNHKFKNCRHSFNSSVTLQEHFISAPILKHCHAVKVPWIQFKILYMHWIYISLSHCVRTYWSTVILSRK
jgi:hypothetical protein